MLITQLQEAIICTPKVLSCIIYVCTCTTVIVNLSIFALLYIWLHSAFLPAVDIPYCIGELHKPIKN